MITTQNLIDIVEGIVEKVDNTPIPQEVQDYIRMRKKVKERLEIEAQDTAHLHAMYVMDAINIQDVDVMDDFGWELLYISICKRENIPLSFVRALSYQISSDFSDNTLHVKIDKEALTTNQRIMMGVVFDGVRKALWELDDAKLFADDMCPNIPYFDKAEWENQLKKHMGGHVLEDMIDVKIPKGGEDVFLL